MFVIDAIRRILGTTDTIAETHSPTDQTTSNNSLESKKLNEVRKLKEANEQRWSEEAYTARLYSAVGVVALAEQRRIQFRLGAVFTDRIFCTPTIDIYASNKAIEESEPTARIMLNEQLRDDMDGEIKLRRLSAIPLHSDPTYTAIFTDSQLEEAEKYFKQTIKHFRQYLFDCEIGHPTLPCFRDVRRSA